MATIPVPRSYNEILGDMVDAFLSRYGLRSLKVGSPVLSILESVAQSQLRSSEDIFTLLEAQSLDNAEGVALDRIGADESTPRITQTPSTGSVTITDTSFAKISSKIFQGTAAPIAGSTAINVLDASTWNTSGSVYIGRGTSNYEGPIAYTSKVNNGTYWTINLSTPTLRFHNIGEPVVVAQGGDRSVSAGTIVQTSLGNTSNAIQFKTLFTSTIPDGETQITGVLVVATQPGLIGNIAASAINSFATSPFTGASVSNPLPFTNGTSVEDDDTYRERIRQARQTRTKGTELAIQTNAVGVIATDENKRVLSASVVRRQGLPVTLFIDDGTGYEMVSSGASIETLMDSALGGEQYFKVANRPISKASVTSTITAPFTLSAGLKLRFAVGGVATEHTFSDDGTFNNIANATAYEVVASINANPLLNWQARTASSGTYVVVTAKADTNESIQCQIVTDGVDANSFFGFSTTRVDSVRLYKNDLLLNKDGKPAILQSATIDQWSTLSGPQALSLKVDGITLNFDNVMFSKFTDADFIAANTGYTTLGKNSLAAWAAVFNYRIPGITATVSSGTIVLSSNRGNSSTASLQIVSGDLVTNHMFSGGSATGANNDYTLNRNTGEIGLASALIAGDKLTAGSKYTRAFLQTPSISTVTLSAQGNLWFAIDSGATVQSSGVTNSTSLTFTATATAYGFRIRCTAGSAAFTSQLAGDWVTFWDSALGALSGSYRINYVDPGFTFFEFDKATTYTGGPLTLAAGGMQFWRLTNIIPPTKVSIASGSNYTATSFAAALAMAGAQSNTYRTNYVRVNTDTFSDVNGDIALVAADVQGAKVGLSVASATKDLTGHMASLESGSSEMGTPHFRLGRTQAITSQTNITIDRLPQVLPATFSTMQVLRSNDTSTAVSGVRYSTQYGFRTSIADATTIAGPHYQLDINKAPEQTWLIQDRVAFLNPFMLAADDTLVSVIDGDTTQKRFTTNMFRTVKPTTNSYTASNNFTDTDNGGSAIATAFGQGFVFNDFAAFMPARGITNSADATRTILWRYYRPGPDGNNVRVQFQNPKAPNASVGFSIDSITNATVDVGLTLSSGAQRTTTNNIRATTYLGYVIGTPASGVATITYICGFTIASGTRAANNPTLTLTLPSGCTDHNLQTGYVLYVNSTDVNYPSGTYSITRVSATQISYTDTSASTLAFSGTGDVSRDAAGEATLSGSSTIVGDFFYTTTGNPFSATAPSMRLTAVNAQNWSGLVPYSGAAVTVTAWAANPITSPTTFYMMANPAQTAAQLVTSFAGLTNKIVSPTLLGAGGGLIDRSSDELASASPTWVTLVDGANYIKTGTFSAGNYTFVFKNPVDTTLASVGCDWQNETVKLIPLTAKNVSDFLSTLGVTGLSSVAEITTSSNAAKIQIASLTAGSAGSVQVQGGSANAATATIGSSAVTSTNGNTLITQIPSANAVGMYAGQYCYIDNTTKQPKSGIFDLNTNLTSFAANGTVTLNAGGTPIITKRSSTLNAVLKFEKNGTFVAISDTGLGTALSLGSVVEGDYISLVTSATPTGGRTQIAPGNAGLYRVVRVVTPGFDATSGTVWIENVNYNEQNNAECDVVFLAPNSILPGDVINIGTTFWGSSNVGQWTVTSVGGATAYGNAFTFTVDVSTKTPIDPGAVGALGASNSNLIQCIEGKPAHLVKKILSISQNATAPTTTVDVKFDSTQAASSINPAAGSVITVLDKLAFSTALKQGIDGYQYNTGLVQAVNRVEYGDPSDPATYPGIVAAASLVNIEGAPIKRIQVSVALRVRSGSTSDIAESAKSAIAAVINSTGVGESIALIDIAEAAKVPGVISTVMINPLMTSGTDLINVQPYEKPLVLNLDQDIQISFIGE